MRINRGKMKIYIDADACPQLVKKHIFRAVERRKIYLIQVANQYIRPSNSKLISSVLVGQGADVADLKIVEFNLYSGYKQGFK